MENYKEKYEQAMLRMNKWVEGSEITDPKEVAEFVFPELKESEDERIRKNLREFLLDAPSQDIVSYHLDLEETLAWLEKQGEPTDKGEISDGYHTFNELYYYRMLYNAAFFNMLPKEWVHKSKKHNDGEECFGGGWFIVMANLPTGQISNHYELKDWDLFQIPEKETADKWDGHTPQEAAERLHRYLLKKQGEQKPNFCHHEVDFSGCSEEYRKAYYDGWNNCNQQYSQLKAEQKSTWSVEDSCCYDDICEILINLIHSPKSNVNKDVVEKDLDWLKSLKKRVQPKPKQEWSEEDEKMFRSSRCYLNEFGNWLSSKNEEKSLSVYKACDWLKSLKERMKGE